MELSERCKGDKNKELYKASIDDIEISCLEANPLITMFEPVVQKPNLRLLVLESTIKRRIFQGHQSNDQEFFTNMKNSNERRNKITI